MAQLIKQPILSLCIPIYNRIGFLRRHLERFLEDKELFCEQIQLIISDNCSTDDLKSCCMIYVNQGLRLKYHRHEHNIGACNNFDWCFRHANGKYVWLLGSDDILTRGVLQKLLYHLNGKEYGLVHLSLKPLLHECIEYNDNDKMVSSVSYWLTFVSSNIIKTSTLISIDLQPYNDTSLIQVPAYLNACVISPKNAILYLGALFEENRDFANNGGFNYFKVFVDNFYKMINFYVVNKQLKKYTFYIIKKEEYRDLLLDKIVNLLLLRNNKNYETTDGFRILFKHYGLCLYSYTSLIMLLFSITYNKLKRVIKNIIGNN